MKLASSTMVGLTGLEPVTLRLSSACSNQLSYRPMSWLTSSGRVARILVSTVNLQFIDLSNVEARGFEPLTYSLQS